MRVQGAVLAIAALTVVALLQDDIGRQEMLLERPGESRTAAADYQRYILREVYNDGRTMAKQPVVQMVQQQATTRDLDSYWGKEARKYRTQDVGRRRPVQGQTRVMARTMKTPAKHFVKTHTVADLRVTGAVPWDATWRRPKGASSQPLERYDTQVHAHTRVAMQGLRLTAAQTVHATAMDMPAMPGSFDSLLKKMHH